MAIRLSSNTIRRTFSIRSRGRTRRAPSTNSHRSRPPFGRHQTLFDDLIGSNQQTIGQCNAERLRGLEVHEKFKVLHLLNWKVAWASALEHACGIDAGDA